MSIARHARTSKLFLIAALLLPAALLPGCSSKHPQTPPGSAAASNSFASPRASKNGTYFVLCTPRPIPIPLNQVFSMEVSVFHDAAMTRPASAARVRADADMPAHGHGMTLAPRVARIGDGRFRVEGMLMHMPGAWEIYIDVDEGNDPERATFEVEIR